MLNSSVPTLAAMLLHDVSSRSASTLVPASASACTVGRRTGRDQAPVSQSAAPPSASSASAMSLVALFSWLCVTGVKPESSRATACCALGVVLSCALSTRLPVQAERHVCWCARHMMACTQDQDTCHSALQLEQMHETSQTTFGQTVTRSECCCTHTVSSADRLIVQSRHRTFSTRAATAAVV